MKSAIYIQIVAVRGGGECLRAKVQWVTSMAEDLAIICTMCRQHLVGMIGTEIVNAHCN